MKKQEELVNPGETPGGTYSVKSGKEAVNCSKGSEGCTGIKTLPLRKLESGQTFPNLARIIAWVTVHLRGGDALDSLKGAGDIIYTIVA